MKKTMALASLALAATAFTATPAKAGTDAYLGEVIMIAGVFCPRGTMEARGQLLSIVDNSALYALLGTTYGGDGRNTFRLPNLKTATPSTDWRHMKHCIVTEGIFPSRS